MAVGVSSSTRTMHGTCGGTAPIAASSAFRSKRPCCMSMMIASAPACTAISINGTLPMANQNAPRPGPSTSRRFSVGFFGSNIGQPLSPAFCRSGKTRSMKKGSSSV